MRHNLLNNRARRGVAGRQWRSSFASTLAEDLGRAVDELGGQVIAGWALLLDDLGRMSCYRPAQPAPDDFSLAPSASPLARAGDPHDDAADDPMDVVMRAAIVRGGMYAAPGDLTARVLAQLPTTPPPLLSPQTNILHPESPYRAIKQQARVLFGAVSVSAALSFVTSWLLAATVPSLALTLLAALVTVGLLLAEGVRLVVQVTAGVASNPVLVLMAMLGPLMVFLMACTQLARHSRIRLA